MKTTCHPDRIRCRNTRPVAPGPVIYWMTREQRVEDNWALIHAHELALERREPLIVVFTLSSSFLGATIRHYSFMINGLREVERRLLERTIPMVLLTGNPTQEILKFTKSVQAGALVTDFSPLKIHRQWKERVAEALPVRLDEVDAHNIVPVWKASPKLEFGAYTIRPKINRLLPEFLTPFPVLRQHPNAAAGIYPAVDWNAALTTLKVRRDVAVVPGVNAGEAAGLAALGEFLALRAGTYDVGRNDPTADGQSGLSPYLHFGQLSAQRVALEARSSITSSVARDAFLEELIVRRELSDNYCFYNPHYDSLDGIPAWARRTLDEHRSDPRDYLYTSGVFESARTHDPLWNAAQRQMVSSGKMHGYMRMYWAKKILEWTASPEEAMAIAIELNDRYELDGRDPNGYAGIAWSIGGVHDRAWFERPVYGKIRYMNAQGCRRKFDTDSYIARYSG